MKCVYSEIFVKKGGLKVLTYINIIRQTNLISLPFFHIKKEEKCNGKEKT